VSQKLSNFEELAAVVAFSSRAKASGVAVGRIVGLAEDGHPLVDFAGNESGSLAARYVVPMSTETLASFAERQQEVLLAFEGDDVLRPVITGILQPVAPPSRGPTSLPETAVVDGQCVRIEGRDEIVLSCGEASITLRRNGRVVIRGTHLESDSLGANWIRGVDIQLD
jgi:hypothetical protein